MRTLIIYCDESVSKGSHYSNFYGGALVESSDYDSVVALLEEKKNSLNLFNEIKWTKVTSQYLEKYISFIDLYFDLIQQGKIKIRIMFRKNEHSAMGLDEYQKLNGFYLLYYQFFKHAFGIGYCNPTGEPVRLITFFDSLPNTEEQNTLFKNYIYGLQNTPLFHDACIQISRDNITDIDSKKHVILQGMDIILGSIQFKLNKDNRRTQENGRRGKKTIAKEKLYRHILYRIQKIYPNFNIGITTGFRGNKSNIWLDPYRHWSFIPSSFLRNGNYEDC